MHGIDPTDSKKMGGSLASFYREFIESKRNEGDADTIKKIQKNKNKKKRKIQTQKF